MTVPFSKKANTIVKKLAKRSLQSEKRRNIMVVISVALAAFLISFSGGLAVSLIQLQNDQVIDTYEAVFSNVTEQDVQSLKELRDIARVGEYYMLGQEVSGQGYIGSFVYADEAMLHIGRQQMGLTTGRLPNSTDEILVSESWLSEYAPGIQTGEVISLDTDSFQGEYVVSGTIEPLVIANTKTYPFIVSKEALRRTAGYDPSGYRAYIHLKNAVEMSEAEIKSYCNLLMETYSFISPAYNTQYFAWNSAENRAEGVAALALLAAVVLLGGCTVIQSIFRISVMEKIQSFGRLRTLGATKKQITRMVKKEGWYLGWRGIFAGILPGVVVPLFLIKSDFSLIGYIVVVLVTTVICVMMVNLSILKPVRLAANISPMEATRFLPPHNISSHNRGHRRLTPLSLGLINFRRDKKKTIEILVSLSIGGILLLTASTLLLTYSPESYARKYFPNGNYKIFIDSEKDLREILPSGNPLTEELRNEILAIDSVDRVIAARQSLGAVHIQESNANSGMCDMITEVNAPSLAVALTEGTLPSNSNGIVIPQEYLKNGWKVGTILHLSLGERTATVSISGVFDLSKCSTGYGHGGLQLDGAMCYLPKGLFEELLPDVQNFDYAWEIVSDPDKDASVKSALERLNLLHTDISMDSFSDRVAYNQSVYATTFHILQGISVLISLFGIINLINTTLSNQISRKGENSILRSVGLTRKQLYQTLTVEGFCYALFSVLITIILGLPLAYNIHHIISDITYGAPTKFQFPFLYMSSYILVLFFLEFMLSIWTIRRQEKQSLIEQIRSFES